MSDDAPIDIQCPECLKKLRAPAKAAGKRIRCPNCSHVLEVPAETGTTALPPPPPRKPLPPPEPISRHEPYGVDDEDEPEDRPRRRRSSSRGYDDDDEDADRDDDDDFQEIRRLRKRPVPNGTLTVLAICMLVLASLAFLLDVLNCVMAFGPVPPVDPNDPPFVQGLTQGMHGPGAAAMQGAQAIMSLVTIGGSIQMLRRKTWGLALTACILSMIHLGSCCCVPGLVLGIWAMTQLMNAEVKDGFS